MIFNLDFIRKRFYFAIFIRVFLIILLFVLPGLKIKEFMPHNIVGMIFTVLLFLGLTMSKKIKTVYKISL